MPAQRLRTLIRTATALAVAGPVAVIGGLTMGGSGVMVLVLAGAMAAVSGAGFARSSSAGCSARHTADVATVSGASATGAVLLLVGLATIGGAPLVMIGLLGGAVAGTGGWLVRSRRQSVRRTATLQVRSTADTDPPVLVPVGELSTEALGREWLRTAGALAAPLEPASRQHVVRRRQDTLDELERRDPAGFSIWLATGAPAQSDPADHIHGDAAA